MKKKIFIYDKYHHKNHEFLKEFVNKKHIFSNFEDAEIVLSAETKLNPEKHQNKIFVFGPHFGKRRMKEIENMNNKLKNSFYIQPSQPSVDLWIQELKYNNNMPISAMPFGVNTEKFSSNNFSTKTKVFIYFKGRKPQELQFLENFLKNLGIEYHIFNYKKTYDENDYIKYLKESKYGIWLGCHESQGFALQEALSMNVPLLVWNVKLRNQEYSNKNCKLKTEVTTIPFWDKKCGEFFYQESEFVLKFDSFIKNLNNYSPREFILENLSYEVMFQKWNEFLQKCYES